jgi:hypothetical protein
MKKSRLALSTKEDYLLFGDFADARQKLVESDEVSQYELKQLAMMTGIDETTAFLLVDAIEKITKKRVFAEVKKQTDSLLYWVERV